MRLRNMSAIVIICFAFVLTHNAVADIPEFYQLPYNLTLELIDRNNRTLEEISKIQKSEDYIAATDSLKQIFEPQLETISQKSKKVLDDNSALREKIAAKAAESKIDLKDCDSIQHEGSVIFVLLLGSLKFAEECLTIHIRQPFLIKSLEDLEIEDLTEKLGKTREKLDACFEKPPDSDPVLTETKIIMCFYEQHNYIQESYITVLLPLKEQAEQAKEIVEAMKPHVAKCTEGNKLFQSILERTEQAGVKYRECIAKKLPTEL